MATVTELGASPGTELIAIRVYKQLPEQPKGFEQIPLYDPQAKFAVTVYRNLGPLHGSVFAYSHTRVSELARQGVRNYIPDSTDLIHKDFPNYLGQARDDQVRRDLEQAGVRVRVWHHPHDEPTVRLEPSSRIEREGGRRFYVHDDQLLKLASQSEAAAELILGSLMGVYATRRAYQAIEQDAVFEGVLTVDESRKILESFEPLNEEAKARLTSTFQKIGYQSPYDERDVFPILADDERIVATCSEDGWGTYSTGEAAAKAMYEERGSLRRQRAAVNEGRGFDDLTMISGKLAFINPKVGTGLNKVSYYFPLKSEEQVSQLEVVLPQPEIKAIQQRKREEVIDGIARTLFGSYKWDINNGDHMRFLNTLLVTCVNTVTRGIFKDEDINPTEVAQELISRFSHDTDQNK